MNLNYKLFNSLSFSGMNKKRIGSSNDGGYVVLLDNHKYDIIISGGAGNNIFFENELTLLINTKCFLFDHSVKIQTKNENIYPFKIKVDKKNLLIFHLISSHKDIFLKLDIEGGEYEFLSSITDDQLINIKQIIIEIHRPYSDTKLEVLNKLLKYHTLIHFHANNCCGCRNINDTMFPRVFELTLYRTSDLSPNINLTKNNQALPSSIDQKNVKNKPDIILDYFPFVERD